MKITIIGGGPAGLYFAILMKKADPSHEITIYERNPPNDTFGWGVVFSDKTLSYLKESDYDSYSQIISAFETWDNVDVVHRGQRTTVHGNKFSGIARIEILKILQTRCQSLGVKAHFGEEVTAVEAMAANCDLLIGADGINSLVRQTYADSFQPSLSVRHNKYIWYGTNQLFHGLTLTFRQNEAGAFAAHSYKFNKTTSTFIVECGEQTWKNAGFEQLSDEQTRTYLQDTFRNDLIGQPLLSNNSKWINFVNVKNGNWSHQNVVLLGDALHTAHFSIGSGTKLALEDAIALSKSLESWELRSALKRFEALRRPVIEEYQAAALESCIWFENADRYMHLLPVIFAFELMTRSGRVSYESLKRRDPEFIAKYEAARARKDEG